MLNKDRHPCLRLRMLLHVAQATNIFFGSRLNENARFFVFTILQSCKNSYKSVYSCRQSIRKKQFYKQGQRN